ncbi:cell cycle checkpoint protein RAD17-like [Anopheles albimanus]|uniref:AAA+ ATPase domain-containing protein n=1 Tax=Anopheles albimanus TaxID=7167 RepID=A0A1Y9G9I6_ANOAL|nr:cell cycle checkpoint protein RAD17-like [Anopheles albimanus]
MLRKGREESFDLLRQFEPAKEADLAIHVKKIEEIKHWLEAALQESEYEPEGVAKQILLVTGPSGSGKSVCVKTIAKQLKCDVKEWTTPVDVELFYEDSFDFETREDKRSKPSQKQLFNDFLHKSSRYCSLFSTPGKERKVLLVKDFPNSFLRSPEEFHESLEMYQNQSSTPIVFIATDASSKSLDIAMKLFPSAIMENFHIDTIKFNAVSVTLMKKAIKRISSLIGGSAELRKTFQVPPKPVEEDIVTSSQGDLRNCCLNYLFTCLKSIPSSLGNAPSATLQSGRNKTTKSTEKGSSKRDKGALGLSEGLTVMHGLGRILHPKYVKNDAGMRFLHAPEDITDSFISQPAAIISLLHSNYVSRCSDVHCLSSASDCLTVADLIMNEYRSDQLASYGLNLAVRGIMVNNEQTTHGWHQIKKKVSIQLQNSAQLYTDELTKLGIITRPIPQKLFASEYRGLTSIIRN